jgi:glutathione S-transferase
MQKVKIALREKRVPFATEIPHELGSGRAGGTFKAANPRIEVPVLIDDSVQIFESTVILEYIEERWPDPPLLPRDPAARAFARITEDVCDTHYEAVNWGFGEILWYKRASGALGAIALVRRRNIRMGRRRGRANGQSFSALWHGTSGGQCTSDLACAASRETLRGRHLCRISKLLRRVWARWRARMLPANGGESIATIGWNGW